MPRFAANIAYLFAERPLIERPGAAGAAGFGAVEGQFPYTTPAPVLRGEIDRYGLTMLGINTERGGDGRFGLAAVPNRERDFDELFAQALDYITAVGGTAIHCLAGFVDFHERPAAERTFIANLSRAADLAAGKGIALLIEPINDRDRPNYFLNRAEHAADIIAKAGKPNIRIQFDFYHAQIMGGDLLRRFEAHLPLVGHVQIAAVPSRHEPDEGEVNYPEVFNALDHLGYAGWVAAEYHPRARTEDGLAWLQKTGLSGPANGARLDFMWGRKKRDDRPAVSVSPLKEALREVRIESAERSGIVLEMRDAEAARLDMLNDALDPVFAEIPANVDIFDRGVSRGEVPRLWIDVTASVLMGRDKRTYRFVQETRFGRKVLSESPDTHDTAKAITRYVAARLIERERALAQGEQHQPPRRSAGRAIGAFVLGLIIGVAALAFAALILG